MPVSPIVKTFCTTREAATMLGVSVGSVQLWVESGLLQAWKTAGGHRRVMRDSVERLLHKAPQVAATSAAPVTGNAAPGARLRVLVVEDDTSLLRLYQVRLAAWPMLPQVEVTDDAFAALMMMGRSCPDLLITDLHMPGMDGFAMLRALQKMPEAAAMRIAVVSGLDQADIAAGGGLPDGIEVLAKPVPFERLQQIGVEVARTARAPSPAQSLA